SGAVSLACLWPVDVLSQQMPVVEDSHFQLRVVRSGARRHLPSFPTRRSSDLGNSSDFIEPGSRESPHTPVGVCGETRETLEWTLDRKSTRLNSSHVSISYAVFCLKKKMIKITLRKR